MKKLIKKRYYSDFGKFYLYDNENCNCNCVLC